ncbi:hypothetical protein VTO42DRAFT_4396 [Malbranchea cinnamomea]
MTQQIPPLTRANTMPARAQPRTRHSIGACDTASIPNFTEETLYTHPSVKIVKFELPQSASSEPILPDLDYPVDAIETLPWRVSTERIAALGSLKIEMIASTTFLKAGSVIQALLKNCQGWCVDGKSIFVLRIRKLTYYRIELPDETEEDKKRVGRFKEVLSTIIRYEVTPCPFQRGFSVELPPEAKTPRKKKAWTPKHSPSPNIKKLDFGKNGSDGRERENASDLDSVEEESDLSLCQASRANTSRPSSSGGRLSSPISIPRRAASSPVTQPLRPFGSLVAQFQAASSSASEVDDTSLASSIESFHSFQNDSLHSLSSQPFSTSRPPSEAYHTADELRSPAVRGHSRGLSDITVTAGPPSPSKIEDEHISHDQSPGRDSKTNEVSHSDISTHDTRVLMEDPSSSIRRRLRASRKRELSPLPPSPTLLNPSPRSPGSSLTTALWQRACALVLGPPIQFLLMLLRLAAKAAARDDTSDCTCRTDGEAQDSWNEDDFGMPLSCGVSRQHHDCSSGVESVGGGLD